MTDIHKPLSAAPPPESGAEGETRQDNRLGGTSALSGNVAPLAAQWRYANGWVSTGVGRGEVVIADVQWLDEPEKSAVAAMILAMRETRALLTRIVAEAEENFDPDATHMGDPDADTGARVSWATVYEAQELLDRKGAPDAL